MPTLLIHAINRQMQECVYKVSTIRTCLQRFMQLHPLINFSPVRLQELDNFLNNK